MRRSNRHPGLLVVLAAGMILFAAGCGSSQKPAFPVKGRVVYGSAKKPAAGAVVMLTPVGFNVKDPTRCIATVNEEGTFAVTTYKAGDGAPAGDYVITLTWPPKATSVFDEDTGDQLQGAYADTTKSTWKFTVQATKTGNEIPTIELP